MSLPPILLLFLLVVCPTAAAQTVGSRNAGMGGTATASSDYLEAAFNNPALLTNYSDAADDDWGLILPSIGIAVADPDSLLDALEDFADTFDAIDAALGSATLPTQAQLDSLAASLTALNGRTVNLEVSGGLVLAIPSRTFAVSLVVDGYIDAHGFMSIDPSDAAAIRSGLSSTVLPTLNSEARILAAGVYEVGVAVAREFELAGMPLSVGITPKMQQVQAFNYAVAANDGGNADDDFNSAIFRNEDSAFNIDLGATLQTSESWRVGLVLRDALSHKVDTPLIRGQKFTYELAPVLTAGVAWTADFLTVAADLDVNTRDPFSIGQETRYLRVGAEMGWQWAQLRAGYNTDLENNGQDMFTAGIGLSPFGIFHLDIAGAAGSDSYGAVVALSFTF